MIGKIGYALLRWAGAGVFALGVAIPASALLWRCLSDGAAPADGWGFSGRQAGLLLKSVLLALAATGLAVLLALPVVPVLGAGARTRLRTLLWGLVLCPLLLPPAVSAFGWARVLSRWDWLSTGAPLCVLSWATWLWPIPALLVGAGWSKAGRSGYEAARLDAGRWGALRVGALPLLRGHLLAASLVTLVLILLDYNVPHACSIQVYATELLAWASNYPAPIHVLWASVPLVGMLTATAAGGWWWMRRRRAPSDMRVAPPGCEVGAWPAWCVVVLTVAGPQVGLLAHLESADSFMLMARTYGSEIATSLGLALVGGLAGVGLGLACGTWARAGRFCALMILATGFVPGALWGKALGLAFVRVPVIYDHWPILVLAYASRYAWIGLLGWYGIRALAGRELEEAARVDGAGPAEMFWRVRLASAWPGVLGLALAASGMCLADIAAASQVSLPQYGLLSMILMEKFHRFEEQMLVTISLTLQVLPVLGALLVGAIMSRGTWTDTHG